jgi:hypothetical protein
VRAPAECTAGRELEDLHLTPLGDATTINFVTGVEFDVALDTDGVATVTIPDMGTDVGGGGSTIGRHMLPISAKAMTPRSSGGCGAYTVQSGASSQPDMGYLPFDASSVEYAEFEIPMPESWNEGTVTFAPVWKHPSTTTNFGVVWSLQAVAFSNDDTLAANFGTAQTSTDTGGTTDDHYVGPESSAITIAGTPAAGDTVYFRIARETANGSDTMAVDAQLLAIRLYYTTAAETD